MPKYFLHPFANNGDRVAVPDESITDEVSYEQGYTPAYELPKTNPDRRNIDRQPFNGALFEVTENLKFWQENGAPEIVADDGTGSPLSYSKGFVGSLAGVSYVALVDGTTTVPPSAEWQEIDLSTLNQRVIYVDRLSDITDTSGYLEGQQVSSYEEGLFRWDGSEFVRIGEALPETTIADSGDPLGYESEPNIVAMKNGELFCAYRRGSSHVSNDGRIVAKKSSDGGKTWGSEIVIEDDASFDCRNHEVAYDEGSNRIVVFYRKADATDDSHQGIFYRPSTDGGDTWGSEVDISAQNASGATTAAPFGPAVVLDGEILVSVYGQGDSSNRLCWTLRSTDGGVTWLFYSLIYDEPEAADLFLTETTLVGLGQGRIVALIRNNDEGIQFHWCKSSNGGASFGAVSSSRWIDPSLIVDSSVSESETYYRYASGKQEVFVNVAHDFSADAVANYPYPVNFKVPGTSGRSPTATVSPENTTTGTRLNAYKDLVVMATNQTGWNVSAQTNIAETLNLSLGAVGLWDGPTTNPVPINALALNDTVLVTWGSRNDPENADEIGVMYLVEVDKSAFWQNPDIAWTKRRTADNYIDRALVDGGTTAQWRDWGYPFLTKYGNQVLVSWYDSKDGTNETETDIYVKSVAAVSP